MRNAGAWPMLQLRSFFKALSVAAAAVDVTVTVTLSVTATLNYRKRARAQQLLHAELRVHYATMYDSPLYASVNFRCS